MKRGDVYAHSTYPRRFVVVSSDELTELGTVVVAELVPAAPPGTRGVLAVRLSREDRVPDGGAVLAWRVNYVPVVRLGDHLGKLSDRTMDSVSMALRAALDL